MSFQKAKREKIWIKVLCAGPSGAGKTYTALRLAMGIAKKMGKKVAAIDTENGRIRYYANEFNFDDKQLEPPYTPEKYNEAIDEAVDGKYGVLILDSITHEWDYCLDVHSKMPGNSYTNWAKITPRHDSFMEKVLQSHIHIIATVRGKDEYILEEKGGKQVPKKVGLGYKQRDNTEYNYTVTFNIDQQNHIADATKDNTHLFEGKYETLTEKDGEKLYDWANTGDNPIEKQKVEKKKEIVKDNLESYIAKIDGIAVKKAEINKEKVFDAIKKYHNGKNGKPSPNYNSIKDIEIAKKVLKELEELEVEPNE